MIHRVAGQSPAFAGAVAAAGLVFTSGLVSPAVLTGSPRTLAEQAADVFEVLGHTLAEHGCLLGDVVALTAFLAPDAKPTAWNTAFATAFPVDPPARTTVTCGFVVAGVSVEISAIAARTETA
ncbi:RidA family protein [Amycolatopsis alkalitolerans]|uniref:RidA family protein n=1 Tax=Amycolatopsis alkalitolerans TaxID=2547244 RepID=A0A5C4M198_9PSEU|nr:RidA family protein [Amycolatopsis alkalitolerans]TNC25118.1 RidA family protein [Amycolatopsis alkalitolerans]